MITCKLEGGLGNQMLIMAFIIAYAKKHHLNYCVPKKVNNPHIPGKDAYWFSGVNYCSDPHELQVIQESGFRYQEFPPMDNVCFKGFFQSEKYFIEYREEILKAFNLPYKKIDGVVSLHLRFGDYMTLPNHHPVVTDEYIDKATKFFMNRGFFKFKVFSDDIPHCKEILKFKNMDLEYSDGKDEIQDLIEASSCSHNIGSNSSFSFWIYWLNQNKNKMGTFPRRWFGDALNHDTTDLYPKNSIVL